MMKMVLIRILFGAICLQVAGCPQQGSKAEHKAFDSTKKIVDFPNAFRIETNYDAVAKKIEVVVDLDKGIHAYGPDERIGKPVDLRITPENGWRLVGSPEIPRGQKRDLGFQEDGDVLTGRFTLRADVADGQGPIEAILFLQICTEDMCDRPREHRLNIDTAEAKK